MQIQKKNKRDSNPLFLTSQISSYVRVKNEILVISKNRLQPTHAFGDFRLKHQEFNNP